MNDETLALLVILFFIGLPLVWFFFSALLPAGKSNHKHRKHYLAAQKEWSYGWRPKAELHEGDDEMR